jgi:catechol 2,3-dioxygenase-like lactoylglutathione lyase family enzyme
MLADHPIRTTLPATDLERAKRFYAERLGLTPESETPSRLVYRCGANSEFVLFPTQATASGTHTQAGWTVDNIEAEVATLKARGVVFEEYNTPSFKTVHSVATIGPNKAAWFKDSEGNLLGLLQVV